MLKRLSILFLLVLLCGSVYYFFLPASERLNGPADLVLSQEFSLNWGKSHNQQFCSIKEEGGKSKKEELPMKALKYIALLILSTVFLLSGINKLLAPENFAENLRNYQMFTPWMIKLAVVFLPWAEILCGLGLLIPPLRKPSALILIFMNLFFIGVLSIALMKGVKAPCGCFGSLSKEISLQAISRDLIFLSLAVFIYLN